MLHQVAQAHQPPPRIGHREVPLKYMMKEKFFALGNDYVVKDDAGREAFYIDGKILGLGDRLSFRDAGGQELAFIRRKLLSWGLTYEIYYADELHAVVKKSHFTLFRASFSIDVPGPDDLKAQGNFLDHEYTFTRDDRPVATVSKKWFRLTDTYGIDIAQGEDVVLILASAVVIDLCSHEDKD